MDTLKLKLFLNQLYILEFNHDRNVAPSTIIDFVSSVFAEFTTTYFKLLN